MQNIIHEKTVFKLSFVTHKQYILEILIHCYNMLPLYVHIYESDMFLETSKEYAIIFIGAEMGKVFFTKSNYRKLETIHHNSMLR